MVQHDDREFLARAARINKTLAASALPLINHTLTDHDSHQLGTDLIALGHEFVHRAHNQPHPDHTHHVIDGEILTPNDHR